MFTFPLSAVRAIIARGQADAAAQAPRMYALSRRDR